MKGAGSWDGCCYCCSLPFSAHDFSVDEDNYSLLEGRRLNKQELARIESEGPVIAERTKWLNESVGLDSYHNVKFNLESGGDSGDMFMSKKQMYPGAQALYEESRGIFLTGDAVTNGAKEKSAGGLAIHKACAQVLEEAIGRPLKPADEVALRSLKKANAGACFGKYNMQDFAWPDALLNEPISFFSDPTKNATRKMQILACVKPFLAAVKKGGKRKTLRRKRTIKNRK